MKAILELAAKGEPGALEQAVCANSPLVWSIVRRFMPRGYDGDDLYQLGCIGLIKAIRRFDPDYGVQFSTYAVPLITGEIRRFMRDDGMIKVSRHYKEISAGASAARAAFEAKHMREPSLSELAEEMSIDVYELTEALEACTTWDSIYRTVSSEGSGEVYLLDKLLGGDDSSMAERAALKCALDALSERERTLITCRYFMDETQAKVAKRLGISQVQVSRIEKKVLAALRKALAASEGDS